MITKTELLNLAPKHELINKLAKLSLPGTVLDEVMEQIIFWSNDKAKSRYTWNREQWITWYQDSL